MTAAGSEASVALKLRDLFIVANNVEELGGVQRVVHNLATALAARGHRVTVIGVEPAATAHDYGARTYRCVSLTERLGPRMPRRKGNWQRMDPRFHLANRRQAKAQRAAVGHLSELFGEVAEGIVVVMQIYAMNWVAGASTDHLHVIGMSHESYDAALNSTRYERMGRLYRDVDLLLLLTQHDARRYEIDGFNNVGVVHNSLSFYPDESSDVSSKRIVAAGRYAPEKGYNRLIDAFALVAADHPDWKLTIFGYGRLHTKLLDRVEELGLTHQISVPGLADDIEQELLEASVFALSSIHEGLPMALAEAMACGVPCVAFDCAPGVREIVTDGVDGIVVPPRNVRALADGLARLMDDDELRRRYGMLARENIRRFAPDAVVEQWETVFARVER